MGFFDKFIPNEVKDAASKVIKPVQSFSNKFIPNEIRPFLPLLTAGLPYSNLLGPMGGIGGFAKMYGTNLLTQAAADPDAEFDELNQLSAILSGTQGGLMGTKTAGNLRDMTTRGKFGNDPTSGGTEFLNARLKDRNFLTKAKDLGLSGLAETSEYLTGQRDNLGKLLGGEEINIAKAGEDAVMKDLFTGAGAKAAAKAVAVPASFAMGDVSEAYSRPAMREFERLDAEEQAEFDSTNKATDENRANLQMTYMRQAGIPETTVKETLDMNDLGEYYSPPEETAAYGGLMGRNDYEFGGIIDAIKNIESREMMNQNKDMGGMMNGYNMGGSVLPKGMEMDYRQGGFIPMGSKERADDVPARVSKNEFVMTADAVRAAGGGSVNEGARKMYNLMNNLEAKA
jgi:hypothetical protein